MFKISGGLLFFKLYITGVYLIHVRAIGTHILFMVETLKSVRKSLYISFSFKRSLFYLNY